MNPHQDAMQTAAHALNRFFNGDVSLKDRKTGFVLLTFGFDAPGIANYVSNAERSDMITAMRECADRLEKKQDNVRFP